MSAADTSPAELAKNFIETWASGDLDGLAALVDDEISYVGPLAQAEGIEAYLAVVGPFSQIVDAVNVLCAAESGDAAIIMYEMETAPFGTLAVAELLRFRDGLIVASRLVFDTHPVRLAEAAG